MGVVDLEARPLHVALSSIPLAASFQQIVAEMLLPEMKSSNVIFPVGKSIVL